MTCTDHAEYAERIRKIVDSVLRLAPMQRWAFSPLDDQAHLLLRDGDQPVGVLKARCAALLPLVAAVYDDRPDDGPACFPCQLIARADLDAPVPR